MRSGVEEAVSSCRALPVAGLIAALLLSAGASVCQEAASPAAVGGLRADVDLDDVSTESALRFLAELYDVSLATGRLPDARVTLRLRGASADEAFAATAAAAGLEVERRGPVMLVSAGAFDGEARQIVFGPFPWSPATGSDWLAAAGVEATPIGDDAMLLEGTEAAIAAVVQALAASRRDSVVERVFPLGAAPGEETRQAVASLLEPDLESASYDPTGHLLTVSALPSTLDRVGSLLGELTQPPVQFEIEVEVVEVSTNALKRIGAQGFFRLQASGGVLATTFPLEGLEDSARYFPSPNDLATLSNTASQVGAAGVNALAEPGTLQESGFRFGSVDARGIGLLIEFLEQSGDARIMATPKVTALDNRQAVISMVTTLRIPTFTQNAAFATTTVTGIEEIDVGTTLEVRPRRTAGSGILLAVTPEVSEVVPTVASFSQGGLTQGLQSTLTQGLPAVMRRRTQTEVILDAGETLVIGGLVTEREAETVGETPGLAKIPWLGRAFRHKARNSQSSELLVFVTPHLLPPPEERRAKVRIDDRWLPADLASRIQAARGLLAGPAPAGRAAGARLLEEIDDELLQADLDVGHDIVRLGGDADLEARVAAALFLLRRRPETALAELLRFADGRAVAVSALAEPIAPHQRAALSELLARSPGGTDLLAGRLEQAVEARDAVTAANLLEALSVAAPDAAARMAGDLASRAPGLLAERELIDALSGAPGSGGELAERAMNGSPPETRAYAAAGFVRALGPQGTTELLAGRSVIAVDDELRARIRRFRPGGARWPTTETGLGWSGKPAEIVIAGDPSGAELTRSALELLAAKAPDLRHLVGFALARIEVGAAASSVDPEDRRAHLETAGATPEQLALRLVRLATMVFESRVRGFPATGGRALARAVRQEIRALERLAGASCSAECADATVLQVLESQATREAAGA
jgi:hypothetical protein